MIAGSVSFAMHYALWNRRYGELAQNTEVRTLTITLIAISTMALYGLAASGAYTEVSGLFRKGFFTVVSAHSGTGFGVTSGTLLLSDWGVLAPSAIVVAMALGVGRMRAAEFSFFLSIPAIIGAVVLEFDPAVVA